MALRHVFQLETGDRAAALHGLEQGVVHLVGLFREVARNLKAGPSCTWQDIWSAVKDTADLKGAAKVLDPAQGCPALEAKSAYESVLANIAEARDRRRIEATRNALDSAEVARDESTRRTAMVAAGDLLTNAGNHDGELSWPEPIDAATWMDTEPEPSDPIIEGLIDTQEKTSIVAPSKARKSFFALQLCICVAAGIEMLGFRVPRFRKVLLVQFEIKANQFHKRVKKMAHALGIAKADIASRLYFVNGRGRMSQTAQETLARIAQQALKIGAELIVLDPFYKLMDGDENDAQEVGLVLKMLDRMMERTGAAILYVNHTGKGHAGDRSPIDRAVGSGKHGRDLDGQICLTPHRDYDNEAPLLVVEVTGRHNAPTQSFSVTFTDYKFARSDAIPVVRTSKNGPRGSGFAARLTDEAAMEKMMHWDVESTTTFKQKMREELHLTRAQADAMVDRLLKCGKLKRERTDGKNGMTLIGLPEKFTGSTTTSGTTFGRLPDTGNRES